MCVVTTMLMNYIVSLLYAIEISQVKKKYLDVAVNRVTKLLQLNKMSMVRSKFRAEESHGVARV